MIKDVLRHWAIIDLRSFRGWGTEAQINSATLIDNHDGTYGRAFDIRSVPAEMLVAVSPSMALAMKSGMDAIQPLPSGPQRLTNLPPQLKDLIAKYGRYDLIPDSAWAKWDAAQKAWRADYLADLHIIKPSSTTV